MGLGIKSIFDITLSIGRAVFKGNAQTPLPRLKNDEFVRSAESTVEQTFTGSEDVVVKSQIVTPSSSCDKTVISTPPEDTSTPRLRRRAVKRRRKSSFIARPHNSFLNVVREGFLRRMFSSCVLKENGMVVLKSRNIATIERDLISLGYSAKDGGFAEHFPKVLTRKQLETLNKLINACDEMYNPIYKTLKDLAEGTSVSNERAIDAALARGIKVPPKGNHELFARYAGARLVDGEPVHDLRDVMLALHVKKGDEGFFSELINVNYLSDENAIKLLEIPEKLPAKEMIAILARQGSWGMSRSVEAICSSSQKEALIKALADHETSVIALKQLFESEQGRALYYRFKRDGQFKQELTCTSMYLLSSLDETALDLLLKHIKVLDKKRIKLDYKKLYQWHSHDGMKFVKELESVDDSSSTFVREMRLTGGIPNARLRKMLAGLEQDGIKPDAVLEQHIIDGYHLLETDSIYRNPYSRRILAECKDKLAWDNHEFIRETQKTSSQQLEDMLFLYKEMNAFHRVYSDELALQCVPTLRKIKANDAESVDHNLFCERLRDALAKEQITVEAFEALSKDLGYDSRMIKKALAFVEKADNIEHIKELYKISPELESIVYEYFEYLKNIKSYRDYFSFHYYCEACNLLERMADSIKSYPKFAELLGCPSGDKNEILSGLMIGNYNSSSRPSCVNMARVLQKHFIKIFENTDVIVDLLFLSQKIQLAQTRLSLSSLSSINSTFKVLDESVVPHVLKLPEFKPLVDAGGFEKWMVSKLRSHVLAIADDELKALCTKLPDSYFDNPDIFNSIMNLEKEMKVDLNECALKDFNAKIETISKLFKEIDFDKYPELKKLSGVRSIFIEGGLDSFIASKQEKFMHLTTPIAPRLGDEQTVKTFYRAMSTALSPDSIATALKNIDFATLPFKKTGLPLQYTRSQFISDLDRTLKDLSDKEIIAVCKHFGFSPVIESVAQQGRIVTSIKGFNNFPRPNTAAAPNTLSDKAQLAITKLNTYLERFTYENKVVMPEYPEFEKLVNSIIQMIPEFTSIIGKAQHAQHEFSLDLHSLRVLQACVSNPLYNKLSARDKIALNFVALTHDFGKGEGIVDKGHEVLSALYVRNIMEKMHFSIPMQEKIFNLVEKHNWLEVDALEAIGRDLTDRELSAAKALAAQFRAPSEFLMAKIFAEADLKGVNDTFYSTFSGKLSSQNTFISEVEAHINELNKSGIPLNISRFNPNIQGEMIDGINVINFARNPKSALKHFIQVQSVDELRLLIHMCDKFKDFDSLKILCTNGNKGNLSTSLLTNQNRATYVDRRFGVFLDVSPSNIIQANSANVSSGTEKGVAELVTVLSGEHEYAESARKFISNEVKKELNIDDIQFVDLFKRWADKKITEEEFAAIKKATDMLLAHKSEHNEIVAFNPRIRGLIAKVDSWNEVPEEMKKFAKEHNLPILIFGSRPCS